MEDRIQGDRAPAQHHLLLAAVHLRDPVRLAGEQLGCEVAERRDQPRLNQLDLLPEMGLARLDLLRLRVAVARRAALQDVRHVHVAAREADPLEQLAEQLAGGADERHALLVLVEPGRLAHEHQVGDRRAGAEDDLGAGRGQRAAGAARSDVAVGEEREISRSCHRNHRNSRRRNWAVPRCRALRTTC